MQIVSKEKILERVKKNWEMTDEEIEKVEPHFQQFRLTKKRAGEILRMRMQGITYEEIGNYMGVQREGIRRLHRTNNLRKK